MEESTLFGVRILDMEEVAVTMEEREEVIRGKPLTARLYRRKGLAKYIERDGSERLADLATFYDCGPDGISRAYTLHREVEPTGEEREEGRRRAREVVTQALVAQGLW